MCKEFLITLCWGEPVSPNSVSGVSRSGFVQNRVEESDTRQVRELDCVAGAFAFLNLGV